ncbi:GNAT family N-acetyltransferase [Corynebacterium testudinoris]|uniref:Acetyltransferase, ribosomal protein N-acetylase n=1 Tax=Corynebacterium testudinoris TaxID=136857 RepID=A0A0G3H855_9CORY|nr:GNAT family N-acetyltransferase [Corynebacterium testudinoris]AKK09534.1 acetyltransferase, ribosomal protein N-acetylase [Corynebacterium testudinoris]MBX8996221.1 GNAT family N-acetyltransferase [Corynebacterium testudinoris]
MNLWEVKDVRLHGGGIVLRPLISADAADLYACAQDQRMIDFTTIPQPYTLDMAESFIAGSADTDDVRLVMTADDDDRFLGSIELRVTNKDAGIYDIGYHTAPWARGRGLQSVALRLVLEYALAGGAKRVEVKARADNAASRHVAEKAGARFEGIARKAEFHRGEHFDLAVYAVVEGDSV